MRSEATGDFVAKNRKGHRSGDVVWANVPDRNGVMKFRPLLVIKPDPADATSNLCCLAISTDPKNDPNDPGIEMPWDAQTGDITGLHQWCRVVLKWHVLVSPADVVRHTGFVTSGFLEEVLAQRAIALQFAPPA